MEKQADETAIGGGRHRRPPDGWDPLKHVLWCFHEDNRALRIALRDLECDWKRQKTAKFARLNRKLIQHFVVVFFVLAVSISCVVEVDTDVLREIVPWSSLIFPLSTRGWLAALLMLLTPAGRKHGSADDVAAALVPLVMQLEGHPSPHRPALTFKLRERSPSNEPQDDWQALLQLQRQCALPVRAGIRESSRAKYVVPEAVPDGGVILHIPRNISLSTLNIPASVRENCWVDVPGNVAGAKMPCKPVDMILFLLILEKRLQRQALRSFKKANRGKSQKMKSLPPLPCCLIKTNRKSAPFFTAAHWETMELLTPHRQKLVEDFVSGTRAAFEYTSTLARRGLLVGDARILRDFLQASETKHDQTLLDLDVRDAVSLSFNKAINDVQGEIAIVPAAFEFEAQLNIYSWFPTTNLLYEADEKGFTWQAQGDRPPGSQVKACNGMLNNLELIYRYGIMVRDNPLGPAFFIRRGAQEGPSIPFGTQGWVGVHTTSIATTDDAEQMLPRGILKKRTIRSYGTMCYHRVFQEEHQSFGCPPVAMSAPEAVDENNAKILENHDYRTRTTKDKPFFDCDYRTSLNVRPFGYGSFILYKDGPVGGFSRIQYQCLREMMTEAAEDVAGGDAKDATSLIAAEERIAEVLSKACALQLEAAREAEQILRVELKRQEFQIADAELECSEEEKLPTSCRTDLGDHLFHDRQHDIDTWRHALDVTHLLLNATHVFQTQLQRCVAYFEMLAKDIELWKHVGLEF